MTDNREELKGKLLLRWVEDLIDDREPRIYPESQVLRQEEIEEVMSCARFVKATFYPRDGYPADVDKYLNNLTNRIFKKSNRPQTNRK